MSPERVVNLSDSNNGSNIYNPNEQHIPGRSMMHDDPKTSQGASENRTRKYRKARRRLQRRKFRVQLALFKSDIEGIIWGQVVTWALQYAPEKCAFGTCVDFSRRAFGRLRGFQFGNLQRAQVEELMEMVWALKMWAVLGEWEEGEEDEKKAVVVEDLMLNEWTLEEFLRAWPPGGDILFDFSMIKVEGCAGVPGMFAAMVMFDGGYRAGCHNFTYAKAAWKQIIVACTGRTVESMAINSMAWQSRILALVVDRWIEGNKMWDRRKQWNYVNRFLMKDVIE